MLKCIGHFFYLYTNQNIGKRAGLEPASMDLHSTKAFPTRLVLFNFSLREKTLSETKATTIPPPLYYLLIFVFNHFNHFFCGVFTNIKAMKVVIFSAGQLV